MPKPCLAVCRRCLMACAALLGAVALVFAAGVVPRVEADTFALAAPQRAAAALRIFAGGCAAAALCLAAVAVRIRARSLWSGGALGLLALAALAMTLLLVDAAVAFSAHGPAMHPVVVLLAWCIAGCTLAAVTVATIAALMPRPPRSPAR